MNNTLSDLHCDKDSKDVPGCRGPVVRLANLTGCMHMCPRRYPRISASQELHYRLLVDKVVVNTCKVRRSGEVAEWKIEPYMPLLIKQVIQEEERRVVAKVFEERKEVGVSVEHRR